MYILYYIFTNNTSGRSSTAHAMVLNNAADLSTLILLNFNKTHRISIITGGGDVAKQQLPKGAHWSHLMH